MLWPTYARKSWRASNPGNERHRTAMQTSLQIAEIIVAMVLIGVVLLQVRGQSGGLFGGGGGTFRTRRGLEKTLFQFTIVLVVLFIVIAIMSVRLA